MILKSYFMRSILFVFFVFLSNLMTLSFAQKELIAAFYNCENLFDTINAPYFDNDFLPNSSKHWNYQKYKKKLIQLSKVVLSINDWQGPDLIGLCEVENRKVLDDLLLLTPLSFQDYAIVHQDSPDNRGIDVALLYKKSSLKLLEVNFIPVNFTQKHTRPTRDILHIKILTSAQDSLHFFFNHWPSRFGGYVKSQPKRNFVAQLLRTKVDSLLTINTNTKVLIAGDFNDDYQDESIVKYLKVQYELEKSRNNLYSLVVDWKKKYLGTHKFGDHWSFFDQWIVSSNLRNQFLTPYISDSGIVQNEWLFQQDKTGIAQKPYRTYAGNNYLGGFSDHLPIFIKLQLK